MSMSGYAFDALMLGKAILLEPLQSNIDGSLIPLKQSMAIDRCGHSYFASADIEHYITLLEQSQQKRKEKKKTQKRETSLKWGGKTKNGTMHFKMLILTRLVHHLLREQSN